MLICCFLSLGILVIILLKTSERVCVVCGGLSLWKQDIISQGMD